MYENILIPTDGSEGIMSVLPHGIDIAQNHNASIHSIYIVDRRHYIGAPDDLQTEIRSNLESEGTAALGDVTATLEAADINVVSDIREGIPYREILDYINDQDIDLVVLGTHGRTGRDKLSHLGSVTERVIKLAEIPVFVVNIGSSDETDN